MRFEFGVVNYNGGEHLLRCVGSIAAQAGATCGITVFDNASQDGSADAVVAAFPGVEVIRSERNLGYAGALNRLLERLGGDVVVLCNMDLEFDPDWAVEVRRTLEADPGVDSVATLVLEMTEPPVINSLGVRFFPDLHAQNVGSGERYRPEEVAERAEGAFGSYGAVMCFPRESVRELRFDEDYFLFFEETDFFLRFALLGRRTVFAPRAVARHRRSLSTKRFSTLKLYYGERNRVTTVFKLLPVWYWPVSFAHSARRFLALRRQARVSGEGGGAGEAEAPPTLPPAHLILATILRAWLAAVARLPRTLAKRRRFWKGSGGRPGDALALMKRHRLPIEALTLR